MEGFSTDMERQADGMGSSHKKHLPSSLIPFEHEDAAESQEEGLGVSELFYIIINTFISIKVEVVTFGFDILVEVCYV